MDVPTITMDPAEAKAKLKSYKAQLHRDVDDVYKRTAEAYAQLAKGTPILQLTAAIRRGGFFPNMRPKLAIARADRPEVRFHWGAGDHTASFYCGSRSASRDVNTSLFRSVDLGRTVGVLPGNNYERTIDAYALVPSIPADKLPKFGRRDDWHILWEVEQWFDKPQRMTAPTDPYLLKHIGGDLYAVLAEWDLTDVERLVLEEVRRS